MAEAALDRNHKITLLHRTPTADPTFADVEHLFLDRNSDLSSLSGRTFDATIDVCAYVPSQVKRLAAALGRRGGHHVFVSTMSVFAEADGPGIDE
jgi:2'-hydroxyisoflavone reductase